MDIEFSDTSTPILSGISDTFNKQLSDVPEKLDRIFQLVDKDLIFEELSLLLHTLGLNLIDMDSSRPWGGYFVCGNIPRFMELFFPRFTVSNPKNVSPKILIVSPNTKLSWQYHNRRQEIWSIIHGSVAIIKSSTDEETDPIYPSIGDMVNIRRLERHRIIGLDKWSIIAEIWIHTDLHYLSNEIDIVRLGDAYGRTTGSTSSIDLIGLIDPTDEVDQDNPTETVYTSFR